MLKRIQILQLLHLPDVDPESGHVNLSEQRGPQGSKRRNDRGQEAPRQSLCTPKKIRKENIAKKRCTKIWGAHQLLQPRMTECPRSGVTFLSMKRMLLRLLVHNLQLQDNSRINITQLLDHDSFQNQGQRISLIKSALTLPQSHHSFEIISQSIKATRWPMVPAEPSHLTSIHHEVNTSLACSLILPGGRVESPHQPKSIWMRDWNALTYPFLSAG